MGTILAVVAGLSLIAAYERYRLVEARRTQKEPEQDFVTRQELDERLEAVAKESQWLLDEWYDKFSTLHARTEKRAQRRKEPPPPQLSNGLDSGDERPSVLKYRRPWSV